MREEIVLAAVEAAEQEQEVRADGGETLPLPPITEHYEPAAQGGEKYVRCEGCEREMLSELGGREKLPHKDGCAHSEARE